jgi:hypothetical protein
MYTEFEQEEEEEVNNIAFRTCIARQSPRIGSWGPFSCRILISKTNPFPGVGWPSKVNFQTGCPGAARLINYTFPQDFPPTSHVCFTDANFSGANFRWEMPPLPPPPPAPRLRPASTSFIERREGERRGERARAGPGLARREGGRMRERARAREREFATKCSIQGVHSCE